MLDRDRDISSCSRSEFILREEERRGIGAVLDSDDDSDDDNDDDNDGDGDARELRLGVGVGVGEEVE